MKIAFVFGSFCISRPFDFTRLFDDDRGLTGSEVACFCYAKEMAALGHEVTIFTITVNTPDAWSWYGTTIRHYDAYVASDKRQFDVIMAWMNPDFIHGVEPGPLRVVDQQLNDFGYCRPGWEPFVDMIGGLSETHTDYLKTCAPSVPTNKWESFYNGVDTSSFDVCEKVKGRVIYASSPDRGLHLLLQQWPHIRRRVPSAHLRIFYNFDPWFAHMRSVGPNVDPEMKEQKHRALYCMEALDRLKDYGVEHFKSVSRKRIAREMSEAEVLAYPCDPVRWTEGFSNTLMEACYSGAAPVTSDVDALGQLYGGAAVTIHDIKHNLDKFTDEVVRLLQDSDYRAEINTRSKIRASKFSWQNNARRLEGILKTRMTLR
jgi:glycosyltransferase involved in cell wall biosynthesis